MKLKLNITSSDNGKYTKIFNSQAELDDYLLEIKNNSHWGRDAYDEAVFDVDGVTILNTIHHESEYSYVIEDITLEFNFQTSKASFIEVGKNSEDHCFNCLRIIGGYNDKRALSYGQIIAMAGAFSNIESCLNRRMPKTAKVLISAITPDENLVTTELKNFLLDELKDY
jgi:hypothetical protein